jgi:ABC-type transport system involved in cytochrome bd biosynthesis fused ATPase/permease subunit
LPSIDRVSAGLYRPEDPLLTMKFSLISIILWPKKAGLKPRVVPFENGMINVITGESGSGKSSLIHVVDYCLGSTKCSIPVGVIRDHVEWFSILVQLENSQVFLPLLKGV